LLYSFIYIHLHIYTHKRRTGNLALSDEHPHLSCLPSSGGADGAVRLWDSKSGALLTLRYTVYVSNYIFGWQQVRVRVRVRVRVGVGVGVRVS